MKIAFIGQKGIPAKFGGVERHVEELSSRLAKKGHEVFVYSRKNYTDKNLKEYRKVRIINLPSIPTKHLDAISHTLFSIIHALFSDYDIIHFHSIGPTSLSFIIKILKPKAKLIATYHCQDYFHKKWGFLAKKFLLFGEYMTAKIPEKTIVVSKNLKSILDKKFRKEMAYIPNGFSILKTEKTEELEKNGLSKNSYILVVSRLIRHKGIHYLIEAFKELVANDLNFGKKLVIVGDGFHTDEYVGYLKELSKNNPEIIFTGSKTGESLAELFQNAYLFVQPSESEGLSISILEAMGYGKTVLTSNIPENVEATSSSGFYFENKNSKDLKNKLVQLLKNPGIVKERGDLLKKKAEENFSWDMIVEKIEMLYKTTKKKK